MTENKKRIPCGVKYPIYDYDLVCVRYQHKDSQHRSADGTTWRDDD